MNKEEFDSKMTSMLEKIGNDNSELILDDVAVFLSDNQAMNEELEKRAKEIKELKNRNETLQRVNGNLLQQVGTSIKEDDENKNTAYKKKDIAEEGRPIFNMRDAFDSNGNFKN